jgi:hypothetical protein
VLVAGVVVDPSDATLGSDVPVAEAVPAGVPVVGEEVADAAVESTAVDGGVALSDALEPPGTVAPLVVASALVPVVVPEGAVAPAAGEPVSALLGVAPVLEATPDVEVAPADGSVAAELPAVVESAGLSATPPPLLVTPPLLLVTPPLLVAVVESVAVTPAEPAVVLLTVVPEPAGLVGDVAAVVLTPAVDVDELVDTVSAATACMGALRGVWSPAAVVCEVAQPAVKPAPPETEAPPESPAPPLVTVCARGMLGASRIAWGTRRGSLAVAGAVAGTDGADVFATVAAWLGSVATKATAELPAVLADWTIACARWPRW